jgi:hypothetical protein
MFFAWLILRPENGGNIILRNILDLTRLQGVMFNKTEHFI